MPRSRASLALLPLCFVVCWLWPATAAPSTFAPLWSLTGWTLVQEIGNTDGDPQKELIFASKVDGHLALVDGLTGVIAKEFPEFGNGNTGITATDVDGDGRLELFFWRPNNGPVTALVIGYDWNGSNYATIFTSTDPFEYWGLDHLRSASIFDAVEMSSSDFRVRSLAGTVLFRASTDIPGWSGNANMASMDLDQDGVVELGVTQNLFTPSTKTSYFKYSGGFTPYWSVTGWQPIGAIRPDGDPQLEVVLYHATDGHYALADGVSGALEKEFPGFSFLNSDHIDAVDVDNDGREEVFLRRAANFPAPALNVAYDWNGGVYTQMYSHNDDVDILSIGHFRNPSTWDVLETSSSPAPNEVRVRAINGSVLFRASTQIPGWSVSGPFLPVDFDTDGDGVLDLVIQNNGTLRCFRYTGSFTQTWSSGAWNMLSWLPNVDGDPQAELVVENNADKHFAALDALTGAVEREFPEFTTNDSYIIPFDFDEDSRLELYFSRFYFASPLTRCFDWTPSGWVTQFSHNDPNNGIGPAHYRNLGSNEIAELPDNDLRLRDISGLVIFRASTDLPGWTGTNRDMAACDVDNDGVYEFFATDDGAVRLVRHTGTTSVPGPVGSGEFQLLGNAPNPFRASTALRFSTRAAGTVGIRVFDAAGRMVRKLDRFLTAGRHEVPWDGRDQLGRPVPSGILFYEVTADGQRRSGRMVRVGP